jgi:histidine ammonia-lyase
MNISDHLCIDDLAAMLNQNIELTAKEYEQIESNYNYLQSKVHSGNIYYGINTGFGSLCNIIIPDDKIQQLQENLVCSHACGFGEEVADEIVRIMLLLKIKNLTKGYSGAHKDTVDKLVYLYNNNILPVVYEQGSLGASGDLAPLAHLVLPIIGKGKVKVNGEVKSSDTLIDTLKPVKLHAKEGLALLNGTQFMSSYASWCLIKAKKLLKWADIITAMSVEAFDAKVEPYHPSLHTIRPHQGQIDTAATLRTLLSDSLLQQQPKKQVQDPYSFRCVPQVHGATKDAIRHIEQVIEIEINAVTDNPTVFEEEDVILSGGNFHGQPLAINLDYMAIAMSELANISERRNYLLISGTRDLPPFLVKEPGINSGYMITQYAAAAIVSQNKQLCTPASVDSIVSSNGQEDHVSMGANAATKLKKVIENVQKVLAIELMTAAQALDFREIDKSASKVLQLHQDFRKIISFNEVDRVLHDDMVLAYEFLNKDPEKYL